MISAPSRPWSPLTKLLAERSRRGRLASYGLALLALVAAGTAVYAFFPARDEPEVTLELPGAASAVGALETLRVWPRMPVRVSGRHHTDLAPVDLELDDERLLTVTVDRAGAFATAVRIPADQPPGVYALLVRDRGSGRVTARADVTVEDPSRAALALQPEEVEAGRPVAVTGGGFPPRRAVLLTLDARGSAPRVLARTRTRATGLVWELVQVPPDLASGPHELLAVTPDGLPLGVPGTFEVVEP